MRKSEMSLGASSALYPWSGVAAGGLRAACLLVVSLAAVSCQTIPIADINRKYAEINEQRVSHYRIKPGDTINIKLYPQDAELSQTLLVLPDGRTDPFFMNDAVVGGMTVSGFETAVQRHYAQQIKPTEVSVQITPAGEEVVIEGEVGKPGILPLTRGMTLVEAVAKAEGYKLTACLCSITLRRPFLNPQKPDVYRVRLREYADVPEDLLLLPGDHIFIERNFIIYVRDYFNEYVWGFLPPFLRYSFLPMFGM